MSVGSMDSKDYTVLYIGASNLDALVIKDLVENGYKTIATDINENAAGRSECDYFINADSCDYGLIYEKLSQAGKENGVSYIYSSSERFIHVAEKIKTKIEGFMGGCGDSYMYHNKSALKKFLQESEVPTSKSVDFFGSRQEINRQEKFPIIVKPVTGWASSGVEEISGKKELIHYCDENKISHKRPALIEEICFGQEVTVGGIVKDGVYYGIFEYETVANEFNYQVEYLYETSDLNDRIRIAHERLEEIIKKLGKEHCIIAANFFLEKEEALVLEFAPVISLAYMNLTLLARGWSPLTESINIITGMGLQCKNNQTGVIGVKQVFTESDGKKIIGIDGLELVRGCYGIINVVLIKECGYELENKTNHLVPVLIIFGAGRSKRELKSYLDDAALLVRIEKE